jgi:hypothetical protein
MTVSTVQTITTCIAAFALIMSLFALADSQRMSRKMDRLERRRPTTIQQYADWRWPTEEHVNEPEGDDNA